MSYQWTTIQISKEFKKILSEEKDPNESFEKYIKKMREIFLKFMRPKNEDREL